MLHKKLSKETKLAFKLVKEEVKNKQNNKCYICGREIYGKSAQLHHIIDRRVKDLFADERNLILLCPACHNLGIWSVHKTSILLSEIIKSKEPERYKFLIEELKKRVKFLYN